MKPRNFISRVAPAPAEFDGNNCPYSSPCLAQSNTRLASPWDSTCACVRVRQGRVTRSIFSQGHRSFKHAHTAQQHTTYIRRSFGSVAHSLRYDTKTLLSSSEPTPESPFESTDETLAANLNHYKHSSSRFGTQAQIKFKKMVSRALLLAAAFSTGMAW